MNRRHFVKIVTGGAVAAALPRIARAQPPGPTTYVYKTVGECQIKADVYPSAQGAGKPAVMWIHGGALIMGSRKWPDARFFAELQQRGFAVVSIDYRLAPETKLPGIIEDLQDAWRWLRREGPKRFGIDPERMATAGGSAGRLPDLDDGVLPGAPPPRLVSYFGYGDITTPWYSQPDEFYRRKPLVPKEDAYRLVGNRVLSEPPASNQRGRFYRVLSPAGHLAQGSDGARPARRAQMVRPVLPHPQRDGQVSAHIPDPRDRGHRRPLRGIEKHGRQVGGVGRRARVRHGEGGRSRAVGSESRQGGPDCPTGCRVYQDPYELKPATLVTSAACTNPHPGWPPGIQRKCSLDRSGC